VKIVIRPIEQTNSKQRAAMLRLNNGPLGGMWQFMFRHQRFENRYCVFGYVNGEIVGWAFARPRQGSWYANIGVYVDPFHRERGFGTAILKAAEALFNRKGWGLIKNGTSTEAGKRTFAKVFGASHLWWENDQQVASNCLDDITQRRMVPYRRTS
jgi:GNAT superfamily N-acetyltransferase